MASFDTAAQSMVSPLSWKQIREDCAALTHKARGHYLDWVPQAGVYGVPTGGCFVAAEISRELAIPLLDQPTGDCLIVDDLIDSGKTLEGYPQRFKATLYRKSHSPTVAPRGVLTLRCFDGWLTFPWEVAHPGAKAGNGPTDAVVRLLEYIGEDPMRDGLRDTPGRVTKALKEMTKGYADDPKQILARTFEQPYDEVIVVRGIPFTSLCEHHVLPFIGTVDIGYLPGKVVGLSKLPRLVECFSQRLQLQERMTRQIADAIQLYLEAQGTAVVVKAAHNCMACRGVKKSGVEMVTSCMLGVFREKPEARAEFLSLCQR